MIKGREVTLRQGRDGAWWYFAKNKQGRIVKRYVSDKRLHIYDYGELGSRRVD